MRPTVVYEVFVVATLSGKVIFNVRKHDVKVNISSGACDKPATGSGTVEQQICSNIRVQIV